MVVQFLGHVEGCLEWFDPANCSTPCPEGCPPLDGCNLVVTLNYPDFNDERINEAAINYTLNDYIDCQLSAEIADIPDESGGDISLVITVSYDQNCEITTATNVTHTNPDSEFLVPVTVNIVCV